jgi:2-dehydro-3-deoxygluconokinase
MKRVGIIGECMIELNGRPFGEMRQTFGGDSLNTAVYMSRMATGVAEINYITAMGRDPLSMGMIERWALEGVNCRHVLLDEQRFPGLYLIQLDDEGERTFLYWRSESAARYLVQHPQFAGVAEDLMAMDMIYLSGISLAILPPADRLSLLSHLEQAASRGVHVVFDSNFRPALWKDGPEEARQVYRRLLAFTHLAIMTLDDEQMLWGETAADAVIQRLHDDGVRHVVIKQGAESCLISDGFALLEVPTTPVEHVVDTTSAGDSFNAAFMSAWLSGLAPEACARRGHRLAATVIQHKGAIIPRHAMPDVSGKDG